MHLGASVLAALPLFALSAVAAPCSASSTSSAPITSPTAPYSVIAARSASPIHLHSMNAAGQAFWLGGETSSYCPDNVEQLGGCPPGNVTAFIGLGALDTVVPGGQSVYVAPGGYLGFTQAHAPSYPQGSVLEPFTYSFTPGAQYGYLSTDAFGANGFMACPNSTKLNDPTTTWQVFASIPNAIVPTGNISDCLGFDALAPTYSSPDGEAAAWEYV